MGRKKTSAVAVLAPPAREVEPPSAGNVIPDGDFAGLRYDDVLTDIVESIHDALGEISIEGAGAALDMAMGEYLAVVQDAHGDREAKLSAIRFCETALPYAMLPISVAETYASTRKIKGQRK